MPDLRDLLQIPVRFSFVLLALRVRDDALDLQYGYAVAGGQILRGEKLVGDGEARIELAVEIDVDGFGELLGESALRSRRGGAGGQGAKRRSSRRTTPTVS
jgi:hypothetical protein